MAFASAFRRILNGSSTPSPIVRSQFLSIRLNSTLTTSKLSVSDSSEDTTNQNAALREDEGKDRTKRLGRNSLKMENLLGGGVGGEEKSSSEALMLFHASGLTCNQWRKLKSLWFPGKTLFRPSCLETTGKKKGRFFAQVAHSAGPTCMLYLPEEAAASDKLELLRSLDSIGQDMLLLFGQDRSSTLVGHMDVEKASDFDELETSLFHFYLPSSYLSFVCSGEE